MCFEGYVLDRVWSIREREPLPRQLDLPSGHGPRAGEPRGKHFGRHFQSPSQNTWGSFDRQKSGGPRQPPGLCCLLLFRLYIQLKTWHKAYGNPHRGQSFIKWDHCSPLPARSPWGHRCLKNSVKFILIESKRHVMWKATGVSSARACRSRVRCPPKGASALPRSPASPALSAVRHSAPCSRRPSGRNSGGERLTF